MKRVDVVNLEWTSRSSRDRQAATLVNNYLRLQGYKVHADTVFKGLFPLLLKKPKLFFITNGIGAPENHRLVKSAKEIGYSVATLISEGNFKSEEGLLRQMIWGWNKDQVLYEDIWCLWSSRTKKLLLNLYPDLAPRVFISGGTGFDAYKIVPQRKKKEFLTKWKKKEYTKVIGVGCWDFGLFDSGDRRFESIQNRLSERVITQFLEDRDMFCLELGLTIQKNPDTLFILKQHPGVQLGEWASGIEGLSEYSNVLILKNEEPIIDCIAVSDIWIVYESTTALEAWLLDKPTCLLNPSGTDFPRDDTHRGSPNFRGAVEIQSALDQYYHTGSFKEFKEKETLRTKIIQDVIQWDDGLNHIRAGNAIINLLEKNKSVKVKVSAAKLTKSLYTSLKWTLRKSKRPLHLRFSQKEVRAFEEQQLEYQKEYYHSLGMSLKDLRGVSCL